MTFNASFRLHLLLIILVGLILHSLFIQALSTHTNLDAFTNNDISTYEQRFSKIGLMLNPKVRIGYITENGSKFDLTQPTLLKEFYLAQYALAPVLIESSTKPDILLANLHTTKSTFSNNLTVLKDFGNGVVLLRYKE